MKRHLEIQDEDIVTTCIEIIQKFIYLWSVMDKVKEYSSAIGIVFVVLLVLVVGFLVYKGLKKSK